MSRRGLKFIEGHTPSGKRGMPPRESDSGDPGPPLATEATTPAVSPAAYAYGRPGGSRSGVCPVCGDGFVKRRLARFCSPRCRVEQWRRERVEIWDHKSPG